MTKDELEACMDIYGKDIYAFCNHLVCKNITFNKAEADDLFQDTFLTAMKRIDSLDCNGNIKSYLISIAIRIWNNRRRKFAWRNRIADTKVYLEEVDEKNEILKEESIEETFITKEERDAVWSAIRQLPEKMRIPILLFYMEDCSIDEISNILKTPKGTVKSRLFEARKRLKMELEVLISEA